MSRKIKEEKYIKKKYTTDEDIYMSRQTSSESNNLCKSRNDDSNYLSSEDEELIEGLYEIEREMREEISQSNNRNTSLKIKLKRVVHGEVINGLANGAGRMVQNVGHAVADKW